MPPKTASMPGDGDSANPPPLETKAHEPIGQLNPGKLAAVVHLLEVMVHDGQEDEEISPEEEAAAARSKDWFKHSEGIPFDHIAMNILLAIHRLAGHGAGYYALLLNPRIEGILSRLPPSRAAVFCSVYAENLRTVLSFVGMTRFALIAEILFLRRQLALYQERKIKPRRATRHAHRQTHPARAFPVFPWRRALAIVQPATFLRWHRNAFRLFWRWKSRPRGRAPIPANLRHLIRQIARDNPSWGQQRIANELLLKLGIRVSSRTIARYLASSNPRPTSGQRWRTFLHNHARQVVACDFFVSITATFRVVYVFVAMEVASRRILHLNATRHPTAEWTTQQFREFLAFDHPYRFVIHDRDSIFSKQVDLELKGLALRVLRTPTRMPTANAFCERLIGTLRRQCLDFVVCRNEGHLLRILRPFVLHYNRGLARHSPKGAGGNHPRPRFRPASTGISCRRAIASVRRRCSADCTMSTAWKRRLLSGWTNFLRSTGAVKGVHRFSDGRRSFTLDGEDRCGKSGRREGAAKER